jgi:hypothetical protein
MSDRFDLDPNGMIRIASGLKAASDDVQAPLQLTRQIEANVAGQPGSARDALGLLQSAERHMTLTMRDLDSLALDVEQRQRLLFQVNEPWVPFTDFPDFPPPMDGPTPLPFPGPAPMPGWPPLPGLPGFPAPPGGELPFPEPRDPFPFPDPEPTPEPRFPFPFPDPEPEPTPDPRIPFPTPDWANPRTQPNTHHNDQGDGDDKPLPDDFPPYDHPGEPPETPLTPEEREALKHDPAHGGKVTPGSEREAEVIEDLYRKGEISKPERDESGAADFKDAEGRDIDIKRLEPDRGHDKESQMAHLIEKIGESLRDREYVVIDTGSASDKDTATFKDMIERDHPGWVDHILWHRP